MFSLYHSDSAGRGREVAVAALGGGTRAPRWLPSLLRRASLTLALRRPPLGRQAPLAGGGGGARGTAALGHHQRSREPLAEARERQLTVARLRALVLGDRDEPRSDARQQALALSFGERGRAEHVEA